MFTGIITDLGTVKSHQKKNSGARFVLKTGWDMASVAIGASIACSGVCLTVVAKGNDADGGWFAVDVSDETLSVTTLSSWQVGHDVNFEQALCLGDELGGHLVSGHVDAVADIIDLSVEGEERRFTFGVPNRFARFVAPKGSVVLDGVSLTVNETGEDGGCWFCVTIIPHTAQMTTFGRQQIGGRVNFEVDLMARYVARLLDRTPQMNRP